jgi:RHS repeat-associated protein
VFDNSSNLLAKSLNTYCENNGTVNLNVARIFKPNGYMGDLISSKQYNVLNLNDYKEEKYFYYNNDTLGKFMYSDPAEIKPSCEGNLRMKINSGGDTTSFYYNLTNLNEAEFNSPEDPKLKYRIIYQDRRDVVESKRWQDIRLPVRTVTHNRTAVPIITYNLYNSAGLITDYVDANKNLTIIRYDSLNRVQAITQPYDFVNLYEYTVYDTTYPYVTMQLKPHAFGVVNTLDATNRDYMYQYFSSNSTTNLWKFYLYSKSSSGTYIDKNKIVLDFSSGEIADFTALDSIKLKIYPTFKGGIINGNSISNSNYRFVVTPLDTISLDPQPGGIYTINYPPSNHDVTRHILNVGDEINGGQDPCSIANFHYNNLDITNTTLNHMSNQHNYTNFYFMLDIEPYPRSSPVVNHNAYLSFLTGCTPFYFSVWKDYYTPVLEFKGTKKVITPRVVTSMDSATVRYKYYNAENKVRELKKLTNASYKISETFFDGFRKPVKTKMFTSPFAYDSSTVSYNYLDQKSAVSDGLNHITKFSYDEYNNLSQTQNTDNTSSFTSSTYISSLSTSFYNITNTLINVQEFKDETDRRYIKYTDVVGRLLRETRFVSNERSEEDGPFDPDSSEVILDSPGDVPLHTDYKYDALYRVIEVKTPANKHIFYTYDGFGRQKQRETPDAGIVYYSYDKKNNLVAVQDAKQRNIANYIYTFRTYDGLSRLLTLGETQEGNSYPDFANLDIEDINDNPPGGNSDLLTVNVYDTLTTGSTAIFNNVPSDYHSSSGNNTKGSLVCTAFRTTHGAAWNYKFYRYDSRARVIRLWTYLDGLGWKVENYYYNSQNQVVANQYQYASGDARTFNNVYDFAGRLSKVGEYYGSTPQVPIEDEDTPGPNPFLVTYAYNQNSQILQQYFKTGMPVTNYTFDSRNWVRTMKSSYAGTTFLEYGLVYNPNGNIRHQYIGGNYKNSFSNTNPLYYNYIYDKSNRLVKADETSIAPVDNYYDLINTYDSDGNILKLKRYGLSSTPQDDFTYMYESGTNKLLGVDGKEDSYTYDLNGNVTYDKTNEVWNMKYDFRNLLVSCVSKQPDHSKPGVEPDEIFYTEYIYDEAGNRINKKVLQYNGFDPQPVPSGVDAPGTWTNYLNEYYVRNVSGAEVALYNGTALEFWNIYGSDNIGRINADTTKQFYLKDHLGSIRCAINSKSEIISAQDFDAWGYKMDGRKFSADESKYKFTSKERDIETDFDYFGARYYDARIGRWGGVDIKHDKNLSMTPYQYARLNPMMFLDPSGKDEIQIIVRTYIPSILSVGPGFITFHDNRGPEYNSASYRTEQKIVIETLKERSLEPEKSHTPTLGFSIGYDVNRNGIPTKMFFEPGEGSLDIVSSRVNRDNGANFTIKGEAWQTKVPFAHIDYELNFSLSQDDKGNVNVNVDGKHDGYPATEIWVKNLTTGTEEQLLYDYRPDSWFEIYKLADGVGDVKVKENKTIQ